MFNKSVEAVMLRLVEAERSQVMMGKSKCSHQFDTKFQICSISRALCPRLPRLRCPREEGSQRARYRSSGIS